MIITLRGSGRVELPAYGVGDAEATVEKELRTIFPAADVTIRDVRRIDPNPRIVETFEVSFTLRVPFQSGDLAADPESARRKALAAGRRALLGTRYEKTVWDRP